MTYKDALWDGDGGDLLSHSLVVDGEVANVTSFHCPAHCKPQVNSEVSVEEGV